MTDNYKYYSEMEKYEIININDGEKYNYLSNNDVVVDENGNLKLLIIATNKNKFAFWSDNDFIEVPWDSVKKIGSKTIIIDFQEDKMKKNKI